jgi:hypothetical protein
MHPTEQPTTKKDGLYTLSSVIVHYRMPCNGLKEKACLQQEDK